MPIKHQKKILFEAIFFFVFFSFSFSFCEEYSTKEYLSHHDYVNILVAVEYFIHHLEC